MLVLDYTSTNITWNESGVHSTLEGGPFIGQLQYEYKQSKYMDRSAAIGRHSIYLCTFVYKK